MAKVYVSIGSNVDRERNIASALSMLVREYGQLEQSTTYETQAVGFEGDPFYNLVIGFETDASPRQVAETLRRIEDQHGRHRNGGKFSDRSLDLDLLLHDDLVLDEPDLKIPRPEILEYAFVLRPLAEIAGERKHPLTGFTFAAHWDAFDPTAQPMWPIRK